MSDLPYQTRPGRLLLRPGREDRLTGGHPQPALRIQPGRRVTRSPIFDHEDGNAPDPRHRLLIGGASANLRSFGLEPDSVRIRRPIQCAFDAMIKEVLIIAKHVCTYTIRNLRQDKILRNHGSIRIDAERRSAYRALPNRRARGSPPSRALSSTVSDQRSHRPGTGPATAAHVCL